MGRWLALVALASAALLGEQGVRLVPPVQFVPPEGGRVKVKSFSGREQSSRRLGQPTPRDTDRCGHILVVPVNPDVDPGIVVRLPSVSPQMPMLPALPPCQGAPLCGKQVIPSTTIEINP